MSQTREYAQVNAALSQLVGRRFGSISIRAVVADLASDPDGQPIVRVVMTVSDPEDENVGWPLSDVDQLERETLRLLAERDPELPYAVVLLLPETPEVDEDPRGQDDDLDDALDADAV